MASRGDEVTEELSIKEQPSNPKYETAAEGRGDSSFLSPKDFRIRTRVKGVDGGGFDKKPMRPRGPFGNRDSSDYTKVNSHTEPPTTFYPYSKKVLEKNTKLVVNLPEDPRISKLLRRLCAETDLEKSLVICSRLQEAVMLPENIKYIRRCYDILVESLLDVFYEAPGLEAKEQASVALGRIGYVMGPEFKRHLEWIRLQFSGNNSSIKHHLIGSFIETFRLESENPCLSDFVSLTMAQIQSVFDVSDIPEVFMSSLNAMITLSNCYPDEFAKYFVNTVDILIGWHVDVSQTKKIKSFCVKTMLRMSRQWQADVIFSTNLLNQFFEDMVSYANDLPAEKEEDYNEKQSLECVQRVTSFINVSNAVIKSLGSFLNPNVSPSVTWNFLGESITKLLNVLLKALHILLDDELIVAGNECLYLFLELLQTKLTSVSLKLLFDLIELELEHLPMLNESVKLSVLDLISKIVKEVSSNLTVDFIKTLISLNSNIRKLRFSKDEKVMDAVLGVYINLLNLKNIPLLQESYRYVLSDLQTCFDALNLEASIAPPNADIIPESEAARLILFYLQCLSDLANASNSIIGMWALQPSILELLGLKIKLDQQKLTTELPYLQYALIYLLYSHTKKNNYFIASSELVSNVQGRVNVRDILGISNITLNEISTSSPTSGHFVIIINVLIVLFNTPLLSLKTLQLLLIWSADIISQLEQYLPMINHSEQIMQLIASVISLGRHSDKNITSIFAENLKMITKNKHFSWSIHLLEDVAHISLTNIDNNDKRISDLFENILLNIPWDITHREIDKMLPEKFQTTKTCFEINTANKINAMREYMNRGSFTQIQNYYFILLMNKMLHGKYQNNEFLINAFNHGWPLQHIDKEDINLLLFRHLATNYCSVVTAFVLSECALLCVNQKLRTPLGKPQETFTSIESSLKATARDISTESYFKVGEQSAMVAMNEYQMRSRWIIEFLQYLEKYIYNAAEGTASVLPVLTKQVKTFYRTNWPTCREWFTRIRPAAIAVGYYAGHPSATLYNAQMLLLSAANSPINFDMEAIIQTVAKCLITLKEPELLHGMYVWLKQKFNKRYTWLKAAAEQANCRYEIANDCYFKLITTSETSQETVKENEITASEKAFVQAQLVNSYRNIQSWDDLQNWQIDSSDVARDNEIYLWKQLKQFDETQQPFDMGDWNVLSVMENKTCIKETSYDEILNKVESTLMMTALQVYFDSHNVEKFSSVLNECNAVLKNCMSEFGRDTSTIYLKKINVLQLAYHGLNQLLSNGSNILNPFQPSVQKLSTFGINLENKAKVIWWSDYFTKLNATPENLFYSECLRLELIRTARKHSNIKWARRELLKYFQNKVVFQKHFGRDKEFTEMCNILLNATNLYELDMWSPNNSTALKETCKLLYVSEESKRHAVNLCANISLGVSQRLAIGENNFELRERGTRLLLTLAKWVQNESDEILMNNAESPLLKLISALPEIGLVDNNVSANVIPLSDSAVGKLLQFSVNQCPGLAKAWSNFASWCFRWGRKMVEYSSKTGEQLTKHDKIQIENIMIGCTPKDFEAVCEILSRTKATCDDEDIDWNEINTSEMIENQLRSVKSLTNAFPEHISLLVDIWRQAQKRVFSYYELSADAYFKFLQLICSSDFINHSGEYAVVSATLRLLRLIVKHAMELQTVLETGLANTPTQPWKVIIPQLFSRLNHPETYVRKCVSDLLCRLAEDTPHLITFPAVVGAVENEQIDLADISFPKSLINEGIDGDDQDYQDDSDTGSERETNNDLYACFLNMVETLSKQAPETILQVKLLVKELQRINLLWEELWLGSLAQHHSEFNKRVSQLEHEILCVKRNENLTEEEKIRLIKEKHRIIFEPIVFILEQLNEITSAPPETPHEANFQKRFSEMIKIVIDKVKYPLKPDKPLESWTLVKQLQVKFQQRVNRRTSYVLKMIDISPVLANLSNTVISMPGVQTNVNAKITIRAIENKVAILPTKTKPKKLIFHGSDGKSYTYLFKGLEDLHLDERIMQFLSIANTMMARDAEANEYQTYRARHYSVIPLGPRSGLISWVDNMTPLFALYKRWQHREVAVMQAKTNKPVNVHRPSELYYNKLTSLLQKAGLSFENRKEWPLSILKQVLVELSKETPSDLLWRELWCGSVTPEIWWQTVRRFSFSLAVMSTIGYIIGLGDRHLDNVLVDLTSGEVVHIDYNVCFEKGKSLRVPEKVPFRMTPNLVRALGVTGVEGIFRVACEHVMKVMRRGRETLLTLLEAFVYDPLVEWGGGAGGAAGGLVYSAPTARNARRKRKQIELKAAADMLAVRCCEIRHDWNSNRENILKNLPTFKEKIETWLEQTKHLTVLEENLENCQKQRELIKEVASCGSNLSKHPLYAISQKYSAYKQTKNTVDSAIKGLVDILSEYDNQIACYNSAMEAINGAELMELIQEFSVPNDHDNELIFDAIKEFLQNAGQGSMISQCEQAETELIQSIQTLNNLIRSSLDVLAQYASVSQYFPQSFSDHSKTIIFRKWIAAALEMKSPEMCREAANQIATTLASEGPNNSCQKQINAYNHQLQTANTDATLKLNKAFERLQLEGGPECTVIADENLNEAKSILANFLRQDKSAVSSVEAVIIRMLCGLNRRYLMLESSAQSAGDCLVDLTSREGEWFMEEMGTISAVVVELLSFIPIQTVSMDDEAIFVAVNSVKSSNLILCDLNELNFNFQTIILPEAVKKIQAEDPSMLFMMNELNQIILNAPLSLNEIVAQLEMHFKYLVMEMESPVGNSRILALEVRSHYEALLNGVVSFAPTGSGAPDPGRMLLMGFNGLFAPLSVHGTDLMESLMPQDIPNAWKKIDQLSEAIDMSAPLQNEQLRLILEDIFMIKRIQVIADVFGMCAQISSSFQGIGPVVIYDDDRLCRPVKGFIADYMSRCFLGVHSRALSLALCLLLRRRGLDITAEVEQKEIGATWKVSLESICNATCPSIAANSRVGALIAAVESAVRRRRAAYRVRCDASTARAVSRTIALWGRAHARAHGRAPPNRALRRRAADLVAARTALAHAGHKAHTLVKQVHQRLKWGAGANPALAGPLSTLEAGWAAGAARARQLQKAASRLAAWATALAPPDHVAASTTQVLTAWEKACVISNKVTIKVEPVEEAVMELLHPEGAIDTQWVQNVSALLSDMTQQLETDIKTGRKTCASHLEKLMAALKSVQEIYDKHKLLISPIKPLLRVLNLNAFASRVTAYEAMWKFVLESMKKPALEATETVLLRIDDILEATPEFYDDLLRLDLVCSDESSTRRLMRQAAATIASKSTTSKQGENVQGAGVWKRVRLKLEGRDIDPTRRANTHEQVDYIIKEATDIDNLSLMYEGWMAWV